MSTVRVFSVLLISICIIVPIIIQNPQRANVLSYTRQDERTTIVIITIIIQSTEHQHYACDIMQPADVLVNLVTVGKFHFELHTWLEQHMWLPLQCLHDGRRIIAIVINSYC